MKKKFSIVLSVTLLALCLLTPLSASAAGGASISMDTVTCKQGETVSAAVRISGNTGLAFLNITPVLSASGVSTDLTRATNGTVFSTLDVGRNLSWSTSGQNTVSNGVLATLQLKVSDTLLPGKYAVSFTVNEAYDAHSKSVAIGTVKGYVQVVCKTHSFGVWESEVAPTCTKTGKSVRVCSACGLEETRADAATGHSYGEWEVQAAAGCGLKGVETRVCTACGHKDSHLTESAGHSYGEWTTVEEASCEAPGEEERICQECGNRETREIAQLEHRFSEVQLVKKPTLTSAGIEAGICELCGKSLQRETLCEYTDSKTGISVQTQEGAFKKGTKIAIDTLKKGQDYIQMAGVLSSTTSRYKVYILAAQYEGAEAQPEEAVTISIPVPEGWSEKLGVYTIAADGQVKASTYTLSEDGSTASVRVDRLGVYALCDLSEEAAPTGGGVMSGANGWLIALAIADTVLVLAAAGVIFVLLRKRSVKTNAPESEGE